MNIENRKECNIFYKTKGTYSSNGATTRLFGGDVISVTAYDPSKREPIFKSEYPPELKIRVGKFDNKKIFCYAKSNTMIGHRFNDDVAFCRAVDLEDAIEIFGNYYSKENLDGNVTEVNFDNNDVYIATDY